MTDTINTLSRRAFSCSVIALGALAASRAAAAPVVTAELPMGPFYPTGYVGEDDFDLTLLNGRSARAMGDVIEVSGRVLDRLGNPVSGAKIELWQANANGRYAHSNDTSAGALDPTFRAWRGSLLAPWVNGGSRRYDQIFTDGAHGISISMSTAMPTG